MQAASEGLVQERRSLQNRKHSLFRITGNVLLEQHRSKKKKTSVPSGAGLDSDQFQHKCRWSPMILIVFHVWCSGVSLYSQFMSFIFLLWTLNSSTFECPKLHDVFQSLHWFSVLSALLICMLISANELMIGSVSGSALRVQRSENHCCKWESVWINKSLWLCDSRGHCWHSLKLFNFCLMSQKGFFRWLSQTQTLKSLEENTN